MITNDQPKGLLGLTSWAEDKSKCKGKSKGEELLRYSNKIESVLV